MADEAMKWKMITVAAALLIAVIVSWKWGLALRLWPISVLMAVVGGAATFCWPEVWVEDQDYEKAAEIVAREHSAVTETAESWQCPHCGETVDGELAECWNCGKADDAVG